MSTETTKKKIKIDNGTTFGRTYTDKAVDELLKNVGGGGKLEGFTIDVSDTYNPETKSFTGTLTDGQWAKVQNEQIYWITVTYINNQETAASTNLLYSGPLGGGGHAFSSSDGSMMFIFDKSVEGVIAKVVLTVDTQNTPTSQLIPSITTSNEQQNLTIGNGLAIENGTLRATGGHGEIIDLNGKINLDNTTITQDGFNLIQQAYENNTLLGISFNLSDSINIKCIFDYVAIDVETMANIYCFKIGMDETVVLKIKSDLTIEELPQVSCFVWSNFSIDGYEGKYVSSISFDGTIYKIPYTVIQPAKDKYQNDRITFTNETYNKTIYNIPLLPEDASSKTYTLQTVNGVLAWTDAIGDINTILDNINGEVI